ncbi:MAG TPA: PAS domain-containing protein, partial [Nitrospira sp.]|nr:PAS domain-containing protein [Nitrospira sp.]
SEAQLQYALKATNDVVWDWDVSHDTQIWNQAGADLFGWTEIVESPQNAAWWLERVHPDEQKRVADGFQAVVEHPTLFHWQDEYRFLRKDGSYAQVFDRGYVIRDVQGTAVRMIGAMQDMTARKEAEAQVRKSDQHFRRMTESLPQLVWTCRPDGTCDYLSPQWITYTGMSEEPQLGFGWLERLHPEDRERVVAAWNAVIPRGDDFRIEFRIRRHDGVHRWFQTQAVALRDERGAVVKWFGTNTDIQDMKAAEAALRSLADRLEQLVDERTKELVASQDRLRALASELNLAEQRERKRLATELHDHLQQILVLGKLTIGQGKRAAAGVPACEQVLKKVDDIFSDALTYTRTLASDLSPTVLRDHGLAAALRWLGTYMQKHGQAVAVIVPEDRDLTLPEDQVVLLFQSVRELLINSAKHAGTAEAGLTMEKREGNLYITVSDKGKGFALGTAIGGTPNGGISSKFGLFSIRERMRALGGSFDLQSSPGQGTTATLVLPLRSCAEKKVLSAESFGTATNVRAERSALRTQHSEPQQHATTRVLLVDDHIMVRQGLRAVLDAYPDVELIGEAGNGEEAVAQVKRLRPDVVVMDINMPKMNGVEATREITARSPNIVVIGLSVNAAGENQDAMRRAGAVRLITKEAAVEELYGAIQEAIKRG